MAGREPLLHLKDMVMGMDGKVRMAEIGGEVLPPPKPEREGTAPG